jgi:hypothetical protein
LRVEVTDGHRLGPAVTRELVIAGKLPLPSPRSTSVPSPVKKIGTP